MAVYKKLKASEEKPTRHRDQPPRFEGTDSWRKMKADIDEGLKPQEALKLIWTEEDKEKHSITNKRTIQRFIRDYIRDKGLPYKVLSFAQKDTGSFVILVKYTPVIRQRA